VNYDENYTIVPKIKPLNSTNSTIKPVNPFESMRSREIHYHTFSIPYPYKERQRHPPSTDFSLDNQLPPGYIYFSNQAVLAFRPSLPLT